MVFREKLGRIKKRVVDVGGQALLDRFRQSPTSSTNQSISMTTKNRLIEDF